ncbi:MAG TPA: hypothetical protein VNM14_07505 [Planctomycetota bacterium]|nr:hypothetical protein [Planctomycetota bacterium]
MKTILSMALLGSGLLQAQQGPAMPSEKACQEFAQRFQAVVAGDDPSAMDSSIDFKAILVKGIRGVDVPAEFRKEIESGRPPEIPWGATIKKQIEEKGSYRFLRVREQGGARKALFRIISPAGVNYQDYHLAAAEGGRVKVTDIYIYQNAECLSETFSRMMVTAKLMQGDPSEPLTKPQSEYLAALRKAGEARQLLQKGDAAGFLRSYATFPPALQREKCILVFRTMAASQVGEKEALDAMEDFKKAYPGDPCLDLISIDPLTMLKKYDKVLEAIERLDKSVGGDPYLDYIRASVHLLDEKLPKVKECAKRCIEREPTLEEPYWAMVHVALKEKAWAETARWLTTFEKTFKLEIGDLSENKVYAEFIKTPEYKAWLKGREKK